VLVGGADLGIVLRYRKAVTYGHHTLLAALEEHATDVRYEVSFATDAAACVDAIRGSTAARVLVLWSFYSPDVELLAACRAELGPHGRLFFGSFPSEIRPEHVSVEALRLVRRYCDNDNLIVGAQSGSADVLAAAKRGHGVEEVRRAVRLGVQEGFRINVDMIFGMPGEGPPEVDQSLRLAAELADLGPASTRTRSCRCRAPRGGTPRRVTWPRRPSARWTASPAGAPCTDTGSASASTPNRLAEAARAYPRPGRSRTVLPLADRPVADA
jgi:hypothetical protein